MATVRAESACKTTARHVGVLTIPVGWFLASVVSKSLGERVDISSVSEKTKVLSQTDVYLLPIISDKIFHTLISVGPQ